MCFLSPRCTRSGELACVSDGGRLRSSRRGQSSLPPSTGFRLGVGRLLEGQVEGCLEGLLRGFGHRRLPSSDTSDRVLTSVCACSAGRVPWHRTGGKGMFRLTTGLFFPHPEGLHRGETFACPNSLGATSGGLMLEEGGCVWSTPALPANTCHTARVTLGWAVPSRHMR